MENIISLSKKERDLLYLLSLDGRASLGSLSRNLKMSKQGVKYLLDKLERKNIIEGYYAIIDIYKLGYEFYRIFLKFHNLSPDEEKSILEYAKSLKHVGWLVQFEGEFDVDIVVYARNIKEFEKTYHDILERFSGKIQRREISWASKILYYKYRFLTEKTGSEELVMGEKKGDVRMDNTDLQLLNHLAANGRVSLVEIARELNTSAKVLSYRKKRLEKRGIILGYNYKLNHKLLGFTHRKIFLSLNPFTRKNLKTLISRISQFKETIYITLPIGDYDLEFEIMTSTNEEFHSIITVLREEHSNIIKDISSIIFYYEPVINYLPSLG